MAARTIDNCSVIKRGVRAGMGSPDTERHPSGKTRCFGYARAWGDDEPIDECKRCKLNSAYEKEDA